MFRKYFSTICKVCDFYFQHSVRTSFKDTSTVGNKECLRYCYVVMVKLRHKAFWGMKMSIHNRVKVRNQKMLASRICWNQRLMQLPKDFSSLTWRQTSSHSLPALKQTGVQASRCSPQRGLSEFLVVPSESPPWAVLMVRLGTCTMLLSIKHCALACANRQSRQQTYILV